MLVIVLMVIASCEGVTRIDNLENKIEAIQAEQKLRSLEDAERIRQLEDIILSQKRSLDAANHRMTAMENTIEEMKISNKRQISSKYFLGDIYLQYFNMRVLVTVIILIDTNPFLM